MGKAQRRTRRARGGKRKTLRLAKGRRRQTGHGRFAEGIDACLHSPVVQCKDPAVSAPQMTDEYVSRIVLKSTGDRAFEEAFKRAMPWIKDPSSGILISEVSCDPIYKKTNRNLLSGFKEGDGNGCGKLNQSLQVNFQNPSLKNSNFKLDDLDNLILPKVGKTLAKSPIAHRTPFKDLFPSCHGMLVTALRWYQASVTEDMPFVIHADLHANNMLWSERDKEFKMADWGRRLFFPAGRGRNNANVKAAVKEQVDLVFQPMFNDQISEAQDEQIADFNRNANGTPMNFPDYAADYEVSEQSFNKFVEVTVMDWGSQGQHPHPYLWYVYMLQTQDLTIRGQQDRISRLGFWTLNAILNQIDQCSNDTLGLKDWKFDEIFEDGEMDAHLITRGIDEGQIRLLQIDAAKDPNARKGMEILQKAKKLGNNSKAAQEAAVGPIKPTGMKAVGLKAPIPRRPPPHPPAPSAPPPPPMPSALTYPNFIFSPRKAPAPSAPPAVIPVAVGGPLVQPNFIYPPGAPKPSAPPSALSMFSPSRFGAPRPNSVLQETSPTHGSTRNVPPLPSSAESLHNVNIKANSNKNKNKKNNTKKANNGAVAVRLPNNLKGIV